MCLENTSNSCSAARGLLSFAAWTLLAFLLIRGWDDLRRRRRRRGVVPPGVYKVRPSLPEGLPQHEPPDVPQPEPRSNLPGQE